MGAFVVETSLDGVSIGKDITKMGLKASSTAAVKFKDVRVPAANMLGSPGDGFKIAMNILNYGRMALGAASAGMMRRSLKDMQKRAAGRRQFGLAIREFELIEEKMVRASVYAEIAYSMTGLTAGMLMEEPLALVAMESSHCKLFGTTRAWDVLYDALQVSGGSGYLATLPYEKRMRDFRVATVFEGTTEIHSIYPPLYFIRKVSELLKSRKKGKLGSLLYLTGEMLSLRRLSVTAGEGKELKRAASFARKCAARIKFLLHAAMIFYGKRVVRREFFLRRVATMSIYLYGSVSMLARIKKLGREGKDSTRERLILDCFVKEGAGFLKNAPGLRPTGLERAGARLKRHLEQG